MTAKEFAIRAHDDVNDKYDNYLPYAFHLRMVVRNAEKFIHLIPEINRKDAIDGCWNHDGIENTKMTYAELAAATNTLVAEMVRAVTPYSRGRNRAEKMPDYIWQDIRDTPCATFIKLCDRMANVQYSVQDGNNSKVRMYKAEHEKFSAKLKKPDGDLLEMWDYLEQLLWLK